MHLGLTALQRYEAKLQARARLSADIMVRNLFWLTADIVFMASDADLRQFASADADTRAAIAARLREYQRKHASIRTSCCWGRAARGRCG